MAYNKLIDLNLLSNFLSKIKSLIPTKTSDLENDSEYITGMEILSYGNSTWNDFLTAYTAKKVVYCRASSNSNPASGSQTRLAFMAYVNNADNPTNVEFQYYRSVSSHTSTQQGDQVFVYKLDKTSGWSVTTREASSKIAAGTNMTSSYSSGTLTLNASIPSNVSDLTNDSGYITGITSSDVTTALGYTPSSTDTTYSAGNGIDITNTIIKNTQGIEYIVGTQTAATAVWTGNSTDEALYIGKIIAYYLPFAGTSTAATLTLTMKNGATTEAIRLLRVGSNTITTQFAANNVIILIYDGTYWRVSAYYDSDTNTVPTGYCATAAATAAKSATCTYGYRDDTNYFPCLFRYANTAANATLAIASYATTALPIYVNGERTSATNTFGRGVILFLYYNKAYYCYNDGRLPILVDGVVTSVQDYTNELKNTISEISQVITSTDIDSTPITTFNSSAAGMPLKSLTVNIEPVQSGSGDPSPTNIRPISGWTGCNVTRAGKNLFNIPSGTLKVGTINKDTGVIDTSASTSRYTENMLKIKGGANYAFQCVFSGSPQAALYMAYYDSNGAFLERVVLIPAVQAVAGAWSGVVQMRDDASYIRLCGYVGVFTHTSNRQIEEGNEVTDYEPYQGNTYDIAFPSEAGTVYGGTLTVNADGTGKISIDRAELVLTPSMITGYGSYQQSYYLQFGNLPVSFKGSQIELCDRYPIINAGANTGIRCTGVHSLYIYDQTFTSRADAETWLSNNPVHVIYPLVEAVEVTIPSGMPEIITLLGTNNIWADCGDVTVTYGAYLETIKSYANQLNNNIPNAGSISNTGLISIKHDSTELFTIQLPLYNGGVSNGT